MTITIILVFCALAALMCLAWLAKGQAPSSRFLKDPAQHLRSVDVEAFRNLIDPTEEEFLRTRLAPRDFRKIQRERLRAAAEYVSGAAHNAAVLMRLAEEARRSPDAATVAAAETLMTSAIQLRLYALQATPRLYLAMIVPGGRASSARIAERYELMRRQVVMLGLQYPAQGVSAAL